MIKSLRNSNRKQTHPGAVSLEDVLPALDMTQAEFAQRLDVSRLTFSELLHEKGACTSEIAARLAKLLGVTPEPDWRCR
ncbi:MAG: HigA family addiction module antitoxin [Gammaproteobacteria bacterium]